MKNVYALIINWNGSNDTIELIESLTLQQSEDIKITVIVVDNNSAKAEIKKLDDGISKLINKIPITSIYNRENIGVPAAYNQAINSVDDENGFFLRLDNDVVFLKDGVRRLCDVLEKYRNEGVRLVGGNIKYFNNPSEDNGGAVFFDLVRGKNKITYPNHNQICDGVLGCVMLIDGEVVKKFRPEVFYPWLFFTTDESYLSLRSKNFGWYTYYVADPIALHKGGVSTIKIGDRASIFSVRNWSFLSLTFVKPRIMMLFVLVRLLITAFYKTLKGDFKSVDAIFKGIFKSLGS